MDGGSFYSRGMSLNLSRSPAPGMAYSPMQPFAPEHMPLASSAGMHVEQRFPEIGFGQKLDQVVSLIREQVSETASIKEELCSLRSEMNELKQNSKIITESVSSSTASTPVAAVKKIPAELSVCNANGLCILLWLKVYTSPFCVLSCRPLLNCFMKRLTLQSSSLEPNRKSDTVGFDCLLECCILS